MITRLTMTKTPNKLILALKKVVALVKEEETVSVQAERMRSTLTKKIDPDVGVENYQRLEN